MARLFFRFFQFLGLHTAWLGILVCGVLAAPAGHAQESGVLRVAISAWPGYAPFLIARRLGFLDQQGIRLLELANASQVGRALVNRVIDVCPRTMDEALELVENHHDLRIILVVDVSAGADAIVARAGIGSVSDLVGRRVGVETLAFNAFLLSRALEINGLRPEQLVIVPLTADGHETLFHAGKVDAVVTYDPYRTRLIAAGATILFDSTQIPGEIVDVLVVYADVAHRLQNKLRALIDAYFRAVDIMHADRERIAEMMAHDLGVSRQDFLDSLVGLKTPDRSENLRMLLAPSNGAQEAAQRIATLMVRNGFLSRPVNPSLLFDRGIINSLYER